MSLSSKMSNIMSSDEPVVLSVGTEVSAKYKGAFCEAKIKKVTRVVRCKVTIKSDSNIVTIDESEIVSGTLKNGQLLIIKRRTLENTYEEVTINKIFDQSLYTVVFDDGDEATLKRTSLCLKSGKHFAESDTLDQLPLTHPEHFSNPVSLGRRCRRKPNHLSPSTQSRRKKATKIVKRAKNHLDVGKILKVEYGDKRGSKNKDTWFPAVIVSVKYDDNGVFYKVRSFCDDRFYDVRKDDASVIENSTVLANFQDVSFDLEDARQKAITYLNSGKVPDNWDALYSEEADDSSDNDESKQDTNTKKSSEEEEEDEEEEMYEESESEEDADSKRDAFLCGLYSFFLDSKISLNMSTDLGTVNGKDIDLYKLYRTVNYLGGHNRITNRNDWKRVYYKLAFGKMYVDQKELATNVDKDVTVQLNHLRMIYKKYLHSFHELHRKLGIDPVRDSCSSWSNSRPSRGERKERTRLNSVSSVSSFVTPTNSSRRNNTKQSAIKTEQASEATPVATTSSNTAKPTKEKTEEKKRKKKSKDNEPPRIVKSESDNEDSLLTNSSVFDGFSDDDIDSNLSSKDSSINPKEIFVGDCLSVLYGKGKQMKLYDAKVLKIQVNEGVYKFFVHYYGWSTRYDEWVDLYRINKIIKDKSPRRRSGKVKNKGEPLPETTLTNQKEEKVEPTRVRKSSIKSENVKSNKKQQQQPPEETPRRSRTLSFTKKDKEKTKADEKPTPASTTNKRSTKQDVTTPKTKSSKVSKKISESDDDSQSTRSSLKSEKRKDVEKHPIETKKAKTSNKEFNSKRKIERTDSKTSLTLKQDDTQEIKVEEEQTENIDKLKGSAENVNIIESATTTDDVYKFEEETNSNTASASISNNQTDTVENIDDSKTNSLSPIESTETLKPLVSVESSISAQSEALISENTDISLQSSSEDLEVQKILAGNDNSSETGETINTSALEVVRIKITPDDIDLDRSSPGQLVVAEDEDDDIDMLEPEEVKPVINEQDEESESRPIASIKVEDLLEDTNSNPVVPVEPKKEPSDEPPTAEDFPSLLCEETVPASPPSSPLSSPSPQYPAQSLVIDTDQSICSVSSTFCPEITQAPSLSSNSVVKVEQIIHSCPSLSHHQPFSSLIAAASQQSLVIHSNKYSNDKNCSEPSNVVIQSNRVDLKAKISNLNEDDNMEDDNDDDDDDDMDAEDDQIDGVDADVDEFDDDHFYKDKERTNFRKSKIVDRKRRTSRKGSKCASNLSSQDSSQDGDESNFDNFGKMSECSSFIKHSQSSNLRKDDDDSGDSPAHGDKRPSMSPAPSPKKRRRGRMRTISQSESRDSTPKDRNSSFKTRGRYRHLSGHSHSELTPSHQPYSSRSSDTLQIRNSREGSCIVEYPHSVSPISSNVPLSRKYSYPDPQEPDCSILYTFKPKKGQQNFLFPFDNCASVDDICDELLRRLHEIQSIYNDVRSDHMAMDRKRKRAMQKVKEKKEKEKQDDPNNKAVNETSTNATIMTSVLSSIANNSGSESSSSKNERHSRFKRELKITKDDINNNEGKTSDKEDLTTNETLKDEDD